MLSYLQLCVSFKCKSIEMTIIMLSLHVTPLPDYKSIAVFSSVRARKLGPAALWAISKEYST